METVDGQTELSIVADNSKLNDSYSYNYKLTMRCNPDAKDSKDIQFRSSVIMYNKVPTIYIWGESSSVCGTNISGIISTIQEYKWISGPILLVIGLVFVFFGHKLLRYTLALTGFIIG